jgi:hypothetical protein
MDNKFKWSFFLTLILIVGCACNLLTNGLNPIDNVLEEIEDIAGDIAIDEIQDQIGALITDLPAEIEGIEDKIGLVVTDLPTDFSDIEGELEDIATDLPGGFDDIGDFGDLIEGVLGSDEGPVDIPLVDDPKEILIKSEDIITYFTPQEFDFVLKFYQEQMPINGWAAKDGSVINAESALLYYEKPDREVSITLSLNPSDNKTTVMIYIETK